MSVDYSQGSAVPPPPPKKGMGPLGWIAIGCGVIVVLGIIGFGVLGYIGKKFVDKAQKNPAMFGAEMLVRANPDLELVSKDDSTGTITVKNKKTGETATVNLEDIKNGKLSFKTDKGSMTIDGNSKDGGVIKVTDEKGNQSVLAAGVGTAPKNLPSFVPNYPGSAAQGTFDANTSDGHSGAFTVSTKDSVTQVMDFYESQLKSSGLKVEKTTYNANGKDGGTVSGKSDDGKRQVSVILSTDDKGTAAMVTFADKH